MRIIHFFKTKKIIAAKTLSNFMFSRSNYFFNIELIMWESQKNLKNLQKYRSLGSGSEAELSIVRLKTPPPTPETPRPPEKPGPVVMSLGKEDDMYNSPPPVVISNEIRSEILESFKHIDTATEYVYESYPNFMRKMKEQNKQIINSLGKLYGKMRCQLTECMTVNNGVSNISNALRQDGKFLKPTRDSITVDSNVREYVALVTLKIANPGTVNQDYLTQSIKFVSGDDTGNNPINETLGEKKWVRFTKVGSKITVPWRPSDVDPDINDDKDYKSTTSSSSSIIIKIDRDEEKKVNYAKLSSFMYEHMHCKTTLYNGKHLIDVIKSFLYACPEKINYMCLDDATYDVFPDRKKKLVLDSIINKKVRMLLSRKSTVYTNYGLLPDTNGYINISFGPGIQDSSFLKNFSNDTKNIIKRCHNNISLLEDSELKTDLKTDMKIFEETLEDFETLHENIENGKIPLIEIVLEISWENDECWLKPKIIKYNSEKKEEKKIIIQKGRYVDMFKLMIEPLLDNIASQPSLWYDEEKEFFTHENGIKRLTTVKDVLEKVTNEFKSYNKSLI